MLKYLASNYDQVSRYYWRLITRAWASVRVRPYWSSCLCIPTSCWPYEYTLPKSSETTIEELCLVPQTVLRPGVSEVDFRDIGYIEVGSI
ncbi:hypothetical protein TorRG33x02_063970 [Trema orientale]|uniref:Uncharacterized protein n=1 Tax=Trema orientale TaxID=63057 RepID=A0A2P5FJ59_TREOI|nr:hypothetical protein TorRG33x02_063970 [Trema orientale]